MLSGIDIFSGAGGLSLGAELAGISIKCAIEINPSAAKTFKRNHKNAIVLNQDIRTISKKDFNFDTEEVFIIMGGPPCQGFSLSGPRNFDDERNKLYLAVIEMVKQYKPKGFIIE